MKTRIYLRVAKNGYKYKVDASTKSSEEPIFLPKQYNREKQALPTVGFAVDFEIPDQLFSKASVVVATINIATKDATILSGVPIVQKK
jgi:hypothetical protein